MGEYQYRKKSIKSYIQSLYDNGLGRSHHLDNAQVAHLIERIGIFKFKGYVYAFRPHLNHYSIDDVFMLFFFDKYLGRLAMDITSTIETKLKSILVEACYKQLNSLPRTHPLKDNPFFYLTKKCYNNPAPKLIGTSVNNWKNRSPSFPLSEEYVHYGLYYKSRYDFPSNRMKHLSQLSTIPLESDINYPPFHYFIESAVLGTVIYLIKHLRINGVDILPHVAKKFAVQNSKKTFVPYLERLNEVRNRAAHRERLFNRSYRSVTKFGHFRQLSLSLNPHGFADVYLYFYFMQGLLDRHEDYDDFKEKEIERLFRDFLNDYYVKLDSLGLTEKISGEEFEKIRLFVLKKMQ